MTYQRVLVIINPSSGQHDAADTRQQIEQRLTRDGLAYEVRETQQSGDAFEWAEQATQDGFDLVLVAGGDGTIMEAMSGLIKTSSDVPLAQVPAGTSNLLARALEVPIDTAEALDVALGGVTTRIDVGYLPDKERYFAIVAGAGYDAQLIAGASRELKNVLGFFAYVVSGFRNLFTLRPARITLEIDGKQMQLRAHTVMVVNLGQLGDTPIALGPDIAPDDGKLNLMIISTASVMGALRIAGRIMVGRYTGHPNLRYYPASKITIDADPPLATELDGEELGTTPMTIEAVPQGALLVVSQAYRDSAAARGSHTALEQV